MPELNGVEYNEAQHIIDRAIFELKEMKSKSCIDYGKLLAILEGKCP